MVKSRHVTSVTSERPPFPAPRPDSNPYDPVPTDYDDVDQVDVTGYATINDVGQLRRTVKKENNGCDVTVDGISLPDFADEEEEEDQCYNFNKAASRRAVPEMQYHTPRPSEPDLSMSAHSLLNGGRKVSRDIGRLKNSTDSIIRYDSPRPSLDGSNVYLHQPVYKPDTFSANHDYDHVCAQDEGYDVPSSFKPA